MDDETRSGNEPPADATRRDFLRRGAVLAGAAAFMPPGAARAGTGRMAMRDYLGNDAMDLAMLVRHGDVDAGELMELAIARAEAVNPAINALAQKHYELGRKAAARIDRTLPLAGVPFLLKDLNTYIEGTVTSNGSRFFADRIAPATSTLVQRQQAAGLCIFGKTTSPEFGMTGTTESILHGRTRNPWNPEYSSGGSSGGASAAVAAGIVPMAHATDGGGSIRLPAALCGLVGLKPTRGRTPSGPGRAEGWNGLSAGHVVSRSVRDSALMLDLTQGAEPGAAYWAPPPPASFLQEAGKEPKRLRIALVDTPPSGMAVDRECLDALMQAAESCRALGHDVVTLRLPAMLAGIPRVFGTLVTVGVAATLRERATELGREPGAGDLEPVNFAGWQAAPRIGAVDYEQARQFMHKTGFAMAEFMRDIDLVLSPTAARAPWKIGVLALDQPLEQFMKNAGGFSDFTAIYNCTGQPAISLPLHQAANGMPIGVMFGARFGDEATLLQLAAQLERAHPWAKRLSPMITAALA